MRQSLSRPFLFILSRRCTSLSNFSTNCSGPPRSQKHEERKETNANWRFPPLSFLFLLCLYSSFLFSAPPPSAIMCSLSPSSHLCDTLVLSCSSSSSSISTVESVSHSFLSSTFLSRLFLFSLLLRLLLADFSLPSPFIFSVLLFLCLLFWFSSSCFSVPFSLLQFHSAVCLFFLFSLFPSLFSSSLTLFSLSFLFLLSLFLSSLPFFFPPSLFWSVRMSWCD